MSRKHTPEPVTTCPVCGEQMPMGKRVNVMLRFEIGSREKTKGVARLVCRECGRKISKILRLMPPIPDNN